MCTSERSPPTALPHRQPRAVWTRRRHPHPTWRRLARRRRRRPPPLRVPDAVAAEAANKASAAAAGKDGDRAAATAVAMAPEMSFAAEKRLCAAVSEGRQQRPRTRPKQSACNTPGGAEGWTATPRHRQEPTTVLGRRRVQAGHSHQRKGPQGQQWRHIGRAHRRRRPGRYEYAGGSRRRMAGRNACPI